MESRILQLIAALRASGVRVSLAESAEAFSAVDLMGIQHREHFRLSLRSTLIKDVRDLPVFDKLFPLFFGTGEQPMMGGDPTDDMTPEEARSHVPTVVRVDAKNRILPEAGPELPGPLLDSLGLTA